MARKLVIIMGMVLVSALLLVGCSGGSYRISRGSMTLSANSISGEYSSFSGHYFKFVEFKQGESVDFLVSINTDSGKMGAKLIDSAGNLVAELDSDK